MPPDTTNYMILGYAVVVILMAAVVVYLVLKARSLRTELESLEKEVQEQPSAEAAALKSAPRTPEQAGSRT